MKDALKITLLAILITAAVFALSIFTESESAYAGEDGYTVRFYAGTREEGIFYEFEASGDWSFPAQIPQKDGYVFKGWTDGSGQMLSLYLPGSEYSGQMSEDKDFFGLWEKKAEQTKKPIFSDTEKIYLLAGLAAFMVVLTFVYYWFVTKKRSFKDLFIRKK